MRIQSLTLDTFGHFSGKAFNFGEAGTGPDFHIVYGPNEAGKTTTMEAFLRLLYGFDQKERYGFLHERKNLRVSGMLDIDGEAKQFTRLPSRNPSLVDHAGNTLPESALQAHLGGLSQQDYRKLLCLDDDTIEKGGEEIANSKGDIGRLLFSAAAGVSNLTEVLDQAQAEADALYRKRASTTEMAGLKKALSDVTARINEQDITASVWKKLKQTLRVAQEEEDTLRQQRDEMRRQEAAIRAQQTALPVLAEIDAIDGKIEPYHGFPARLDVQPEGLVSLLTEHTGAVRDAERLAGEIDRLDEDLAGIELRPLHAGLADELDRQDDSRSRFLTAQMDLERRSRTLAETVAEMDRSARELGISDTSNSPQLVVTAAQIFRLQEARDAKRSAMAATDAEERETGALAERLAEAQQKLAALQPGDDTDLDIGGILDRFSVDTLAPAQAAASQRLQTAQSQLSEALAALSIQGQRFETLPECTLSRHRVEALAERQSQLQEDVTKTQEKLLELQEDAAAAAARIAGLSDRDGILGDAEAAALLAERNALWSKHRDTLDLTSADLFEAAMLATDKAGETRTAHARELAELRQIQLSAAETKARIDTATRHLTELGAQQTELKKELSELAVASGLLAGTTATELLDWLTQHQAASDAMATLRQVEHQTEQVIENATRLVETLKPHFDLHNPDFETLLNAARLRAKSQQERYAAIADAQADLDRISKDLASRQENLGAFRQSQIDASKAWETLVTDCLAGLVPADAVEISLEPLHALRELEARRAGAAHQVEAMQADQKQFSEAMNALAGKHDIAASDSPLDTYSALRLLAAEATDARAKHDALRIQIAERADELATAQQVLQRIDDTVTTLGASFPNSTSTATLEDLREATAIAQDVIDARTRRAELETQLLACLSLPTLSDARATLATTTATDLDASATSLETDLNDLESRLSDAIARRAEAEHELKSVTGDADVARLVEERTTLELQLEDVAMNWLQLRAGHQLAAEAIRRYRDTHRSSMMTATEQVFAQLTNGAYVRLRTQPEGGTEILQAIDADGRPKMAQDMSKGTRFQLYLALRAAAHAQLVEQGIRLPFFCDDIFETFDEDRTRAACRVMERIGQNGQAIYLTHHRHVVEIAREVCTLPPVVHDLTDA